MCRQFQRVYCYIVVSVSSSRVRILHECRVGAWPASASREVPSGHRRPTGGRGTFRLSSTRLRWPRIRAA